MSGYTLKQKQDFERSLKDTKRVAEFLRRSCNIDWKFDVVDTLSHSSEGIHVDIGDIILTKADGVPLRIEVKRMNHHFTDVWTYKNTVMICEDYRWDKAVPKPWMFIFLNNDFTYWAFLEINDDVVKRMSLETNVWDGRLGRHGNYYHCPLKFLWLAGAMP